MSVKLDTLNTKENKVSKKQYKFEPIEEINVGLLHQVVKEVEQTLEIILHRLKQGRKFLVLVLNLGLKKEQGEHVKVL